MNKDSYGLYYESYSHSKGEKKLLSAQDKWLGGAPQLANLFVSAEAAGAAAHPWVTSRLFQREQGTHVTLPNTSPIQL